MVHLEISSFLLSVWITFRDRSLSLYFVHSKLWYENLMFFFSDGSFRLRAQECLSWALWIVPLAQDFPYRSSGRSWMFRIARAFLKKSLNGDLQYSQLQSLLFSMSDYFGLSLSFRGGLVDRSFLCDACEWMDNPLPFHMYLSWSICNARDVNNHLSIMTTISCFAVESRRTIFFFR